MIYYAPLPDRAVLAVFGQDAREFLQGLITKDMRRVMPGAAVFSVLLSPQGRFLFDFFLLEHEGRFLLETEKNRLPDLIKRLTMYRLRAKVEFEPLSLEVAAVWGEDRHPEPEAKDLQILRDARNDDVMYTDPRLPAFGQRLLFKTAPAFAALRQADYDAYRLSLGIPDGSRDLIVDRSIILEYGYDELGAVDFDKGCYVGQEVTARSKHRATLRKFIHQVKVERPLPPKGTPVMAEGREVGVMASSNEGLGLAHLRVEEAARAGGALTAGDIPLTARLPPWCRTQFQGD